MAQRWAVSADGGFLAAPNLSKQLRHVAQPLMRFRQFVRPENAYGRNKSDRVLFDRISNVATAGRRISELERMPETRVTISQGQVVVDEWGNAIPYTGRLDDLAEFDGENIFLRALRDDAAKTLDAAVALVFRGAPYKATPNTAGTVFRTDGTTGTANKGTDAIFFRDLADFAKQRLIPPYDGENYIVVGSVRALRALKDSTDFVEAAKFGDPERLFSGEVGRYYGIRFVEETNALSNTLGTTNFGGESILIGNDPVVEAIAVPLEIRAKVPTDYGRDKGIAWYYMGGWALTFDTAGLGECRVIHVTSS